MSDIKEYLTSMDSRDSGLINYIKSLEDFNYEDFELENYNPWPHISAKVSV